MSEGGARRMRVASVLEAVAAVGRAITAERRRPFHGRTLSSTQLQVLFMLAHDPRPVTPGRLAESLGVTAGAVTQLVDGLRAEGLVETVPNPDDARSRMHRLTRSAADEVAAFERTTVDRLLPMFDRLDENELATVAALLRRTVETPWGNEMPRRERPGGQHGIR